MALRLLLAALASLWLVSTAVAQQLGASSSPILVIDSERLFSASSFGKRVLEDQQAAEAVLRAENRRIEAELAAEELELTEKRKDMQPAEFRAIADAFDERVQEIRRIQDGKVQEIARQTEQERRAFLQAAGPVLETLMRESGAEILLEERTVFAASRALDITERAITRLNQTLGDGEAQESEN